MIYMDNAATTMHKPQEVIDAVVNAMNSMGNCLGQKMQDGLHLLRIRQRV